MKRLLLALAIFVVAAFLNASNAPTASACSVDPEFDLVRDSRIIVAGRLTGWDVDKDVKFPAWFVDAEPSNEALYNVPFKVHMQVDRVFKGTPPRQLDIAADSLDLYDHEPREIWTGARGACGAFTFDPAGKYVIVALSERDGVYSTSFFRWFFVGDEPAGEEYQGEIAHLASRLGDDFPYLPAVALAVLGLLAFLAGSAFVWQRGEPHNG